MQKIQEFAKAITDNVAKVIVGKQDVIENLIIALLCEGHVLLEDVPGVGKTMLARSLAISLGVDFRRLQCTPDLLPSDITGVSIFNQETRHFQFIEGPAFTHILLADEINRATPRTQSALLEAMQERQTTVDRETHALPRPFLVIATQNPIELEGTFPLPEAQLDRFVMQLKLGYPDEAEEAEMLLRYEQDEPLAELQPVVHIDDLLALQKQVRAIHVSDELRAYLLRVVRSTREHPSVELGVSPRGTLALYRACQAFAALRGREYVIPSDVQHLAPALLTHRIHISPQTRLRGRTPQQVVAEVVGSVPVPVAE